MATVEISRRKLRFDSLEEMLGDAERLAERPHRTTGNWTYGQILSHLAKGTDACFDGFGDFRAPWWARWFIAPFMKRKFLHETMRAGFQLPKDADRLMPTAEVSVPDALSHLRKSLDRFKTETPAAPHPFLGRLRNKDEYILLQLRHSELHMSFVHPVA